MSHTVPPFVPLEPVEDPTLGRLFRRAVDRFDEAPALAWKAQGQWQSASYAEAARRVRAVARLLDRLGVQRGDRVALLSENRPEWAIADWAILALGAVTVPIYPSIPASQVAHVLRDAEARVLLVSTREQAEKGVAAWAEAPLVEQLLVFDEVADGELPRVAAAGGSLVVRTLGAALAGEAVPESWAQEMDERLLAAGPDDLATIIYTSGTTGLPKGVMLTHGNLAAMVQATRQQGALVVRQGEVALSVLPLSHVFERAADYYFWASGVTIAYAEGVQAVAANLREVRPHHMVAVPRLFEKVHHAATGASGIRGRLVRWAARVGRRVVDARLAGNEPGAGDRAACALADRLVFAKIRGRVGGRMRTFICGGAPLAPEVAAFFLAAGLPVYEGYGLSETSPVLAANGPGKVRLGSVGLPYPGVRLRIGPEGEILAKGPGVMRGYWRHPDATAAAFDADGWFRTGDIGTFDADGFLHVTDRLKDLIVTAGGKNVAPQPLEHLAAGSPYVAQAVMLGDRRPYPVMLIVPDFDAVAAWGREHGLDGRDRPALVRDARVVAMLEREVAERLAEVSKVERPKRFAVLAEELTIENGLLTPSQKVRRREVTARYAAVVEALYGTARRVASSE
jgi:long-chain acyl-CoA synthetase